LKERILREDVRAVTLLMQSFAGDAMSTSIPMIGITQGHLVHGMIVKILIEDMPYTTTEVENDTKYWDVMQF